jgi:hypothetical protein
MLKSQDIDYIAQQAYEAGFEGSDSEELPKRLSDQLETGFEYVWLDNYREGVRDADAEGEWERAKTYGDPNWC